jgi:hypothetical protein
MSYQNQPVERPQRTAVSPVGPEGVSPGEGIDDRDENDPASDSQQGERGSIGSASFGNDSSGG